MAIVPETAHERRVVADPQWQAGAAWGAPRRGHPEGAVAAHIEEVLSNIDDEALDARDRQRLRFVALVHDTFKHCVDPGRARQAGNHHGVLARRFAERYCDDVELLELIELHDEAYNAWMKGRRGGDWPAAAARARRLLDRLGGSRALYLRFYRADARTGDKSREPLAWFEQLAGTRAQGSKPHPEPRADGVETHQPPRRTG